MSKSNSKSGSKSKVKQNKPTPKSPLKKGGKAPVKEANKSLKPDSSRSAKNLKLDQASAKNKPQKAISKPPSPQKGASKEVKTGLPKNTTKQKENLKPEVKKTASSDKSKSLKGEEPKKKGDELSKVVAKASTEKVQPPKTDLKKSKSKKPAEAEVEDDFIGDEIEGADDLGEYEEELKAVESIDQDDEEDLDWENETKSNEEEDIVLTDAEGNRYCRAKECDQIASVDIYCRFHYLLFWKKIQIRKKILQDGKLEKYIEELTSRYPDKFLEMIRRDLRTQKDFMSAIQELEIDEAGLEAEMEEDSQNYIDEVRGLGESTGLDEEEY